jgi:hypothetical protein
MRSEMELFAACMCPYAQQCVPLRACVLGLRVFTLFSTC